MTEISLFDARCGSCGTSTPAQVPQLPQPSGLWCGCVATTPVGGGNHSRKQGTCLRAGPATPASGLSWPYGKAGPSRASGAHARERIHDRSTADHAQVTPERIRRWLAKAPRRVNGGHREVNGWSSRAKSSIDLSGHENGFLR